MRILLNGFLIFLVWAALCRYWYVCPIKGLCPDPSPIEVVEDPQEKLQETHPRATDLVVVLPDSTLLGPTEQFAFVSEGVEPDLSPANDQLLDRVAALLKEDPGLRLTVIGSYLAGEEGQTSGLFENLGLARAEAIRSRLLDRGVSLDQVGLDYRMLEDTLLRDPIQLLVRQLAVAQTSGESAEGTPQENVTEGQADAYTFTNMNFSDANFAPNSAVFVPSPTFLAYTDSLLLYMTAHPDKQVVITGHTDAIGPEDHNLDLGNRRAASVRDYLKKKGLKTAITIRTAGEREPVAPNNTDVGRAKNRRVNIQIQ